MGLLGTPLSHSGASDRGARRTWTVSLASSATPGTRSGPGYTVAGTTPPSSNPDPAEPHLHETRGEVECGGMEGGERREVLANRDRHIGFVREARILQARSCRARSSWHE